jgi:hypothetical protein
MGSVIALAPQRATVLSLDVPALSDVQYRAEAPERFDVFLVDETNRREWAAGNVYKFHAGMLGQTRHVWSGTLLPGRYYLILQNQNPQGPALPVAVDAKVTPIVLPSSGFPSTSGYFTGSDLTGQFGR